MFNREPENNSIFDYENLDFYENWPMKKFVNIEIQFFDLLLREIWQVGFWGEGERVNEGCINCHPVFMWIKVEGWVLPV